MKMTKQMYVPIVEVDKHPHEIKQWAMSEEVYKILSEAGIHRLPRWKRVWNRIRNLFKRK